jgi:hypothetical protein
MFTDTTEIIKSIVNSIDYSKQNFSDYKSINWSSFDLSSVPSADLGDLTTVLHIISDKVCEWGAWINCSRMGAEKKGRGLQIINSIKLDILNFNSDTLVLGSDKECSMYETANYIKQKLEVLSKNAPSVCREQVVEFFKKLGRELNKLSGIENDRHYILSRIAENVVEKSQDFQISVQKENILSTSLTISDIENAKEDSYLNAACYVNEKYGKGSGNLILSIFYRKRNDEKYVILDWPFVDELENIINCARGLGVKEIAFSGDCTSALRNLNKITKLGLSFKIEEITRKCWSNEVVPVAVVTL